MGDTTKDATKALDATAGQQTPVASGTGGGPTGDGTTTSTAEPGKAVALQPAPAANATDHGAISQTILNSPEFAAAVHAAVEKRLGSADMRQATKVADERAEAEAEARRERMAAEERAGRAQRDHDKRAAEDRAKAKKGMADLFEKVTKARGDSGGAVPIGEGLATPGKMATLLLDDGFSFCVDFKREVSTTALTVRPDNAVELQHETIRLEADMPEPFLVRGVTILFPQDKGTPMSARCELVTAMMAGGGNAAVLGENSLVFRADR